MTTAIELVPHQYQPNADRRAMIAWWKVAGLLVATGFPTLFWISVFALLAKLLGITTDTPALICVGMAVAMITLVGASLVMTDRH